jgi:hypothetical protein
MAKGKYQKLYEARMKRLGKGSNTEDDLQRQLTNYKARMEAGGVENPEVDDRNALEKLLNLEQDQGLIRDVFEILNRPQQAVFTGIKNSQEGGSFLEGMKEGITGNEETEFKDILMNTGAFEDEKGKLNMVDVLGFAGDVFLDPMNIPVGGFGKVGKALDAGDNIFKAMKQADTVDDLVFKAAGKAVKGTAKVADNAIEKGLKTLDETKGVKVYDNAGNLLSDAGKLNYHNPNAKRASELMPDLQDKLSFGKKSVNPQRGRLERYKQLKNDFTDMFQKSVSSINSILAKRDANVKEDEFKIALNKNLKNKEDRIKSYAEPAGKTLDKVNEDLTLFIESHMDRSIDKDKLLSLARRGDLPANNAILTHLNRMKNQIPEKTQYGLNLDIKVDDKGFIKLGDGWNKDTLAGNGIPSFNELDPDNAIIDYGNWYNDEDLKQIENLKNDPEFRALVNDIFGEIKDTDVISFNGDNIKILDGEEAIAKHKQFMSEFNKNTPLTSLEEHYINDYQSSAYRTINDQLIKGEQNSFPRTVATLDKAINDYEIPEDVVLTKFDKAKHLVDAFGLDDYPFEKYLGSHGEMNYNELIILKDKLKDKIGKEFTLSKGFNSTAVGYGKSFFTEKDTLMYIRTPKGTKAYPFNALEREAVLNRAQKYVLKDVEVKEVDLFPVYGAPRKDYKLVVTVDIMGKDGEKIAKITNDMPNALNKMLDDSFGTGMSKKYPNEEVYFPHVLADETIYSAAKSNKGTILKGKTSLLNERNKLGSSREVNNLYKASLTGANATEESLEFYKKYPKLFEENFTKAFANKYYELSGLAKQHKIVSDVLLDQTFGNANSIKKLQKDIIEASKKGDTEKHSELIKQYNKMTENSTIKYLTKFDSKVPNGFTKIEKDHATEIVKKLKRIKNTVGSEDANYDKLIKLFGSTSGSVAVNTDVLRMLEVNLNENKINEFVRVYDGWLNKLFKTTKTLSPVNTLNNVVGNSSNLYLSGIDMFDQAKFMPKAVEVVKNGQELYTRKIAGEVLSSSEHQIADIWDILVKTGFGSDSTALELQDMPDFMKELLEKSRSNKKMTAKDVATFLPKLNLKTGIFMDNVSRVTVLLKAMDDPGYMTRLGIEGVDDIEKYRKVISKVMFDPSMMTDTERNVMKRIIPFYTYAKNNLVFQIDNLGRNGSRYARTLKGFEHLQKAATGDNEENMSDYIKNSLYIPIPSLDENGNYTILRTSLPFGQLIETVDNPIKQLANMTGPLGKGIYEYSTGMDSFTGRDIEKFPGEKSEQLPFMTKKTQKLLGDITGLDVPLKNAYKLYEGATSPEYGPLEGLGRGALNTVTMQGNIDTDRIHKQYEELDELQNMMKQYQQQGYEFSTMTELRKANKNKTVAGIDAIFAKYGIDEKTYAERKYGQ